MLTYLHPIAAAVVAVNSVVPDAVARVAACVGLAVALMPVLVVAAAVVVLVWHGLRGTDPGPAGRMLITLVRLVLRRSPLT